MAIADELEFTFFNAHHYDAVPEDPERYPSTWVTPPPHLFDPVKGHEVYERNLRLVRLAEELGFDGIGVNEHHNTVFSMTPAVSVMAGRIVTATSRARVQVAGVPVNLLSPNRLAEEYAMLDVMSGGRMEYAFPLGTGMEYWSNEGSVNPTTARARFRESLEVVLKAWTADEVTSHDGEFFNYKFLNPWPKPFQQPHPPVYVVGSGSRETVELAVEFGLGYSIVFVPIAAQLKAFELMRELAAERGRTVRPDELIVIAAVYVGDTDEEAMREARPYYEKFFTWFHKVPPKFLLPPGYVSTDEFLRRVSDTALANSAEATWDEIVASQRIAFGSPDTVADLILHWAEEAQCTRVNLLLQHADMPEWMVVKNMTLFANEVIPRIRARGALVGARA